jgi:hypothetical protein
LLEARGRRKMTPVVTQIKKDMNISPSQHPNPVKNEKKKVETEFCQTKTVDLLGCWISKSA